PKHVALFEALEASMDRENRDEFLEATAKSRKRRHDDHDPLSYPSPESDQTASTPKASSRKILRINNEFNLTNMNLNLKLKMKNMISNEVAQSLLELQNLKNKSTTDQYIFQRRTLVTEEASTKPLIQPEDDTSANIVRDTPSPPDPKTGAEAKMSDSEGDTKILNVVYPKVHKSMMHTTEEQVFLDNSPSSSRTLSSMKNLDDAFTFGDHFIVNKPTEEELGKANVEFEVKSMVTVPIHQDSLSSHLLSTPIIDLTTSKPVSPPIQELVFTGIEHRHQTPCRRLQLSDESYKIKLNLTQSSWDAFDFLFKEDYIIIHKLRVAIYKDRNNQKKMIREIEGHKFSDDTLTRILEKLDHMVKDFRLFKFNSGMQNRIWSEDDKRRSKEFIKVNERRLRIRIILKNLESFVSGRLLDVDYRLI
nr:hypothetical protein [Tanacetum cinerariifolium]